MWGKKTEHRWLFLRDTADAFLHGSSSTELLHFQALIQINTKKFAWPGTPSCTTLYMAMWCLTLLLLSAKSISQAVFTAISMTIFPFLYRLWDFPAVPASSYYTWQWAGLLVSPDSCWLITDFTWSIDTDAHSTEPLHLCSGSVIT